MDYVRLGNTGLRVSRICLGMMTYGSPGVAAVVLDERAEPARSSSARSSTASTSSTPRTSTRAAAARRSSAVRSSDCAPGAIRWSSPPRPSIRSRRARTARGLSRKHILDAIDASLRRLRHGLRRPVPDPPLRPRHADRGDAARRCTTSSRPARPATSARRACARGSSRRCCTRRADTAGRRFVSMQNHYNLVYREEEREMLPLCREAGHRRHPLELPGARLSRGQPGGRPIAARLLAPGPTSSPRSLTRGRRLRCRGPHGGGRRSGIGCEANAGRARLAVVEAFCHGAHHRCLEGHSPG